MLATGRGFRLDPFLDNSRFKAKKVGVGKAPVNLTYELCFLGRKEVGST